MNLADLVRDIRKSRQMSQAVLADLAGTTQSKISAIENGKANVELATLRNICMSLDAEVVIVPRRTIGAVQDIIDQHLHRNPALSSRPVMSVRDELFIPDGED
ncbi:helix-turn-helix domain-containing protein [Rhizobium sp.]|uniref:helix-turn-helix transcriptional regulator n=1 Tax=Rhizobium sp. TaxID=391 RepID=UPI0028A606EB